MKLSEFINYYYKIHYADQLAVSFAQNRFLFTYIPIYDDSTFISYLTRPLPEDEMHSKLTYYTAEVRYQIFFLLKYSTCVW